MKVALISNQNNFNYAIARYLRQRGIDCDLLLLRSEDEDYIYHPKNDSISTDWENFVKQLDWGTYNEEDFSEFVLSSKRKRTLKKDLSAYSFIIAAGITPAYLSACGISMDVFTPMGNDTRLLPYFKVNRAIYKKKNLSYNIRSYFQKKGIREAGNIITGINADYGLENLKPQGKLFDSLIPAFYQQGILR